MTYLKAALSGLAAVFAALVGAGQFLKYTSEQKATGLNAVAGELLATIFSPYFWILAVLALALFFSASRLGSKALRVLLFWTSTLFISTLGFGLFALYAYALVHSRTAD